MVSACLLGIHCRYDGRHSLCSELADIASSAGLIPFCPEQLGGLPTPRPAASIKGGDGRDILSGSAQVINAEGDDVTAAFEKGAKEALNLARLTGSSIAIMKDKSPSCGLHTPYCDKPGGMGIGATAALFELSRIKVFDLKANDAFPSEEFLELIEKSF
ncbi:MAG: DUF523 domain-containing protein [Thermodesulfobacteriota bacterium]|nr:DUF523 domain-containing protein [Thermodesulfobacteriota bacterium]